jgi:hypothetical protein
MPDPTNDFTKPEPRVPCAGCGQIHGGVNVEMNCMRARIRALEAELAPIYRMRAENAALPPSNVSRRGRS